MIRVLFDEQIFLLQSRGGISKYFAKLAKELHNSPSLGIEPVFNFNSTSNEHLLELFPQSAFSRETRLASIVRLAFLCLGLKKSKPVEENVDIIHHTFYLGCFNKLKSDKPAISTIHDFIPERIRKRFSLLPGRHWDKLSYCTGSKGLISVSRETQNDLFQFCEVIPENIVTIHHGVDLKNPSGDKARSNYFLYVGNRGSYKNAIVVLRALALIKERFPQATVRFVGGGAFRFSEKAIIRRLKLEDNVKQVSWATDQQLEDMYAEALGLVFPSFLEGFGLPVLEAQAAGSLVIASDIKTIREVSGASCIYFNPASESELAHLMTEVLSNVDAFESIRALGPLNAQTYTWRKTAEETAEFYKKIHEIKNE